MFYFKITLVGQDKIHTFSFCTTKRETLIFIMNSSNNILLLSAITMVALSTSFGDESTTTSSTTSQTMSQDEECFRSKFGDKIIDRPWPTTPTVEAKVAHVTYSCQQLTHDQHNHGHTNVEQRTYRLIPGSPVQFHFQSSFPNDEEREFIKVNWSVDDHVAISVDDVVMVDDNLVVINFPNAVIIYIHDMYCW